MLPDGDEVSDEHEDVAEVLRRVRDEARRQVQRGDRPAKTAPAASRSAPQTPLASSALAGDAPGIPAPPDATAVNAAWSAEASPRGGLRGLLDRLLARLLRRHLDAQRAFNARQVQLDNEILGHMESRSEATHRHYDRLLGDLGRRLDEADQRHTLLERELVAHVQDLVQRIDLVLADSSQGRLSLELALEEVRERLVRLEDALRRAE